MSSPKNKKRSFSTFESNQTNVKYSANKKSKINQNNTNTKKKKKHFYNFFDIKFNEPKDFNHKTSHCLEFRKVPSNVEEHHLYNIIKTELNNWYYDKSKNKKGSNLVATNGKIDIHLFHNRHNKSVHGFGYIYFENKSDASYILQLSKENKLRSKYKKLNCQWRENLNDRDSYSPIYQTDENLKGKTNIIKLSNLHWKTTLFNLQTLFKNVDTKWMKIIEDKNGYPKNQALIMFKDAMTAIDATAALQNLPLLGRNLKFEYSSYEYNGPLFPKYNENNMKLEGNTNKLLLTNIKQSVKVSDIKKWLCEYFKNEEEDMKMDEMVKDIYLLHNLNRVCGGKCFIEFNTNENTKKCMDLLQFKHLCDRTVVIEYGHNKEREDINNEYLRGNTNRLFITNLVWDVKEKDIKRFFGNKIAINDIYFNIAPNGYPTGSAFITFDGFDIATKAFDQGNGKKLRNRVVKLDFHKMPNYNDNESYNDDESYNDNTNNNF